MNTKSIAIDLSKAIGIRQTVRIGGNDVGGTTVVATIYDGGTGADLSEVTDAEFGFYADGTPFMIESASIDGPTATFLMDEQGIISAYETAYGRKPQVIDNAFVMLHVGDSTYSAGPVRIEIEY